jgi:hypothetical protein
VLDLLSDHTSKTNQHDQLSDYLIALWQNWGTRHVQFRRIYNTLPVAYRRVKPVLELAPLILVGLNKPSPRSSKPDNFGMITRIQVGHSMSDAPSHLCYRRWDRHQDPLFQSEVKLNFVIYGRKNVWKKFHNQFKTTLLTYTIHCTLKTKNSVCYVFQSRKLNIISTIVKMLTFPSLSWLGPLQTVEYVQ